MTSRPPDTPPHAEPFVLIVDDNERNLTLARDVLRAAGFRTHEATTGSEALALASEHLPDVVLLDLRLPDMDGIDVVRALRNQARTARIPVVALSALAARRRRLVPYRRIRRLLGEADRGQGVPARGTPLLQRCGCLSEQWKRRRWRCASTPLGRRRTRLARGSPLLLLPHDAVDLGGETGAAVSSSRSPSPGARVSPEATMPSRYRGWASCTSAPITSPRHGRR